jgi:hypothetical protein
MIKVRKIISDRLKHKDILDGESQWGWDEAQEVEHCLANE